jgi:3-oxoacyl-[acyl-carrier protein] reductase
MSEVLKGKVAVVVGSGQGIGRAVAIGMAQEGAKVVTNNRKPGGTGKAFITDDQLHTMEKDRCAWYETEMANVCGDAEGTAAIIKKLGGEATPFYGDVTDFETAGRLIQTAIDTYGRIDILANIAGAFGISPIEELSEEVWDRVTAVKPKGYFNTIRHAVPHMIKQRSGRIINTTSRAFNGDTIKHAEYCAANGGSYSLTKAVAIELWQYGITCNAISPFAKTRASYELEGMAEAVEDGKVWVSGSGMKMLDITPGPEYIAPFTVYLASDAAASISGAVFNLGGNGIGMYSEPIIAKTLTKFDTKPWTQEELARQVPQGLLQGYKSMAANPFG